MEGKNLKIKLMREYTASLLFIHLTFGVWANREELFLLRTAQKGTEKKFPHLGSMSISIYFNRRWHAALPDLEKQSNKTTTQHRKNPTDPN